MTDYPILLNPPLIEAILDIRVEGVVDSAGLQNFNQGAEEKFPIRREMHSFNIEVKPPVGNKKTQAHSTETLTGYQFLSSESVPDPGGASGLALQARLNGFSFANIRNYDNWEAFSTQAKAWWLKYVSVAHPEKVNRVALRYINIIELPWPFVRFDEYLSTVPLLAPDIDKGMSSYLMRLQLPQPPMCLASVTQFVEEITGQQETVPVTFDIEVSDGDSYAPDSDAIWSSCDNLREIKNKIFFSSITEKARKLFNERSGPVQPTQS